MLVEIDYNLDLFRGKDMKFAMIYLYLDPNNNLANPNLKCLNSICSSVILIDISHEFQMHTS